MDERIKYYTDRIPTAKQLADLYDGAGLSRPTNDPGRMQRMIDGSNLLVTAWLGDELIGASRSIADFSWCCYLADLAVHANHQRKGIGKKLIDLTKERAGEQSMVLLLSVPDAMEYYPKAGLKAVDNAFLLSRSY